MVKTYLALLLLSLFAAGCSQASHAAPAPADRTATTAWAAATATAPAADAPAASVTGTAAITLAPASGYAGTFVEISGEGWPPSAMVLVKLADQEGLSAVLAAIGANAEGRFTTGFVYPTGERWLRSRAQTVVAHTEDGDVTATATFTAAPPEGIMIPTAVPATIAATDTAQAATPAATPGPGITRTLVMTTGALAVTAPHVRVEPFSGRAGATVTVSGGGFPANTPIYVALIETRKASEPLSLEQMQAAATTDERGSYSVRLVIPAIWPDGTLIPAGQLTVVAATADRRTWASVPFDYLGNALPTPLTATPVPPAIASPKPTLTQTPSAPLPEGDTTKVTICHRPPGNPRNARSITIDQSAVPAHLGHGDTLGGCAENGAGASKQDKDKHEATEKEKDKEKDKGKEKGKNK